MATVVMRFDVPDDVPKDDLIDEAHGIVTGSMTVPVDYQVSSVEIDD